MARLCSIQPVDSDRSLRLSFAVFKVAV